MIKKLLAKTTTLNESFEDVLLSPKFNEQKAQKHFESKIKDINIQNKDGETYLDVCLKNNKFEASKWLISKGITVSNKNKENVTAIRLAVEKGKTAIVKDMLEHSELNINQVDEHGRSLLQDAVINGHTAISRALIEKNANINNIDKNNRNIAFDAIAYGDEELIDEITSIKGLNLNHVDSEGRTILHCPSVLGNDNLAKKLLQKDINPTIPDKNGISFITHTALRGKDGEEVLDVALSRGHNLNTKLSDENSVLLEVLYAFTRVSDGEIQRRSELKDVAKKLLNYGSDINDINAKGETVLFETIRTGDVEGCAFLIENGLDVNIKNKNKETPLMVSALKGAEFLDIIILLLQAGANPTIKNKHGQTLPELLNKIILQLHGKRQLEYTDILNTIEENGKYMIILKEILSIKNKDIEYNYLASDGNPLFFLPFMYGDIKTAKLYFQSGLDINKKNSKEHTLFYEYVLKCFQRGTYFKEFREVLVFLLLNGSDINAKNKHGQSIYSKVALIKDCNLKLFRKLIEITRHDYSAIDNAGRTIIHSCVISDNIELLKLVYGVGRNIQNISDNYNILPITYAALQGNFNMVNEFLKRDSIVNSGKPIATAVKEKFQPLLKNLDNLTEDIKDEDLLRKINILIAQIRKDFYIEK
jgi:ankyrin repeat protein